MKVGFCQFRPLFAKPRANLNRVVRALKDVTADLIVLPELPFTGYYFKNRAEAEALAEDPVRSRLVETLIALCRERNFHLVTGFAEKKQDRLFNSALLIGPSGIRHTYRKLHLFNKEKNWFDPGDTPLSVQTVRDARIGMMICFDWIFPEVCRVLAVVGADVICHPSNLVLQYCQKTMLARCIENHVFAITSNRFGEDKRPHGSLRFTGRSQVVAPGGRLVHQAPSSRRSVFVTEIDLEEARSKSVTERNEILSDRRPGFYGRLSQ